MAPILLVSILPVYSGVNTRERNGYHTPLLSDYSSTSKCLLVCECDVALEWYRILKGGCQEFYSTGSVILSDLCRPVLSSRKFGHEKVNN